MVSTDVIFCGKIGTPDELKKLIQISAYVFTGILKIKEVKNFYIGIQHK